MARKKLLVLNTAFMLGLGSILAPAISAESVNELENKKKRIEEQQSGVKSDINGLESKISDLQSKQAKLEAEILKIDKQVAETNEKIEKKNTEIEEVNKKIEELKAQIQELKERIEKRNEVLKERALTYQENGGSVNYLEVVFGSTSFGDFISRVSAVSTILEADRNLIEEHEADKASLESKQKEVEDKLADLEKMKAELETLKKDLSSQKAKKDELLKQLEEEEHEAHNHKMDLEEEEAILSAQSAAIEKAIANEQKRIADEKAAAAAKAAAEKAAAEKAASQKSSSSSVSASNSSSSSSVSASNSSSSSKKPSSSSNVSAPVSSGSWTKPAAGYLTSGYGARWGKLHAGIDIGGPVGTPVVAAASGVVIRSYFSSSYGNCILVSHSINGQVYTTLYAHLNSRNVSSGASVSKGQQIGTLGNTGRSTGPHLHFELHKGSWNASKSNAVNPVGIVPL
ncbi:MAG: murein hydrolase activator EnvC family protein [Bacillus sp. (in: firmicutes)]